MPFTAYRRALDSLDWFNSLRTAQASRCAPERAIFITLSIVEQIGDVLMAVIGA